MFIERPKIPGPQAGLTLIELIIFMVIVGIALVSLTSVFTISVRNSAVPLIRKQMLSIAEAMMDEVTLQPFTYCDPQDANVSTATGASVALGCTAAASVEAIGPETIGAVIQNRYIEDASHTRFNNVSDYDGFDTNVTTYTTDALDGFHDLSGTRVTGLDNYRTQVSVANGGTNFNTANGTAYADDAVLRIDVTVTQGAETLTLTSYALRYAPNSP